MQTVALLARQSEEIKRLATELGRQGFICASISGGNNLIEQITRQNPDILLVEMNAVPDTEALCRLLRRETSLPVLAIAPLEIAVNLNGSVDDFIASSGNAREINIRIKRLLEKNKKNTGTELIKTGKLVIDMEKYEVYSEGKLLSLTFKEYELLRFLASNPGRVFTRDVLLNRVWGEDYFGGDRTVDVHIRRLRSKIEDDTTTYIETVRNIGYRFKKTT